MRLRPFPVRVPPKYIQAVVQVAAGLALNGFPAIFIAVYARIAPIERQGQLAVCLTIGTYIAQLLSAFVIEARLATPGADHRLTLPWWMAAASTSSAALLVAAPAVPSPFVLFLGIVGLSSGLLMARSIGVVRGGWRQEALAAVALVIGCVSALVLAIHHSPHSVQVLAIGALLAVLTRFWPRPEHQDHGVPPDLRKAVWVTAETASVGAIQPTLTTLILMVLGPAASVGFRVISTISGALEPIIAYGRFRQLAHGHRGEVAHVAVIFAAAVAAIFIAAATGLWGMIFGSAWAHVAITGLVIACLWKVSMLISTVPFAALRKAGRTREVFWIRLAGTIVYVILGVAALLIFRNSTAVFASFVLAELIGFPMYHFAAKRSAPDYHSAFNIRREPEQEPNPTPDAGHK